MPEQVQDLAAIQEIALAHVQQVGLHLDLVRLVRVDRSQEPLLKGAPDHRGDFEQVAALFVQAVQPAEDHPADGVGHLDVVEVRARPKDAVLGVIDEVILDQGVGHLDDEQRIALCVLEDHLFEPPRHLRLGGELAVEQGHAARFRERIEGHRGQAALGLQRAHVLFGPVGGADESGDRLEVRGDVVEQRPRDLVDPLDVVDDHQGWALHGFGGDQVGDQALQVLLPQLGVQRADQIALGHGDAQELPDQRAPSSPLGHARRQVAFDAVAAIRAGVPLAEAETLAQEGDPRGVGGVPPVREASGEVGAPACAGPALDQCFQQARLAHAHLAVDVEHLRRARKGLLRGVPGVRPLVVSADQRPASCGVACRTFARAPHRIAGHGLALALDADGGLFLQPEPRAGLGGGALADQHLAFAGHRHEPGGEVDLVAHDRVLVPHVRSHVAGKDAPGVDADPLLECKGPHRRL